MISTSILINKLLEQCQQQRPNRYHLEACCIEILENFQFDCVFVAYAANAEDELKVMAFNGREEIVDTSLYRLGMEERTALARSNQNTYSDMTGKPVFNKSGSLRIQKPNSGIFMVLNHPKTDYILWGCAHLEPRPYDDELKAELKKIWEEWKEPLCEAIHKVITPPKEDLPATPSDSLQKPMEGKDNSKTSESISILVGTIKRPTLLVDEVTRLFNKDYFEECLAIEVERAKRYSRQLSLIFLSVTPLHPEDSRLDDQIAGQIAEILSKSLRRVDVLCRLEKDKYAIILPDTATNTYGIIAKRIFKYFKQVMGDAPPVTLNISASTYPQHADNHISLFKNAEKLLTQAKEVGPNKAVLPE